jgi:peroxin-19
MTSTEQVVETADKRDERETTPNAEEPVVSATPKPVTYDEDSEWEDLDGMFMIASIARLSV